MKYLKLMTMLALVPLLALALAACGGDEADDRPASPASQTPAAAQTGVIEVGAPAPNFSLPTAEGGTVSLADYAGEPVLLFFHMAGG